LLVLGFYEKNKRWPSHLQNSAASEKSLSLIELIPIADNRLCFAGSISDYDMLHDQSGLFVRVVISLLFAPAQDPSLMQQSTSLCNCLVGFLPLGDIVLLGPIATSAPHKSILQRSGRMLE
jgi:hypothetical protein